MLRSRAAPTDQVLKDADLLNWLSVHMFQRVAAVGGGPVAVNLSVSPFRTFARVQQQNIARSSAASPQYFDWPVHENSAWTRETG
jgi:hypothetical protein